MALSDKVVGQVFFNDAAVSNERQRRNQTRHRIIDQLTYDPMFGNLSGLPSDVPVVLAWGHDPILDVEIAGQRPARAANVLYYIPVWMRSGRDAVRHGPDAEHGFVCRCRVLQQGPLLDELRQGHESRSPTGRSRSRARSPCRRRGSAWASAATRSAAAGW